MYRVVFHNNEAMASNNMKHNQFGVEFTDAGKNNVFIPYQAIKIVVKTYEEEAKQEVVNEGEERGTDDGAQPDGIQE